MRYLDKLLVGFFFHKSYSKELAAEIVQATLSHFPNVEYRVKFIDRNNSERGDKYHKIVVHSSIDEATFETICYKPILPWYEDIERIIYI